MTPKAIDQVLVHVQEADTTLAKAIAECTVNAERMTILASFTLGQLELLKRACSGLHTTLTEAKSTQEQKRKASE